MFFRQITSFENQLDYSKYFPQFDNALLIGLLILGVVFIGLTAFLLIRQRKLTIKRKIVLLSISVIYGGFILGGFPNVVFLAGMTFLFLAISLIFSRIFCGYICPLGAIQELISMFRFKPKLNYDRKLVKSRKVIRWMSFIVSFLFIIIFIFTLSVNIEYFINPMYGFLIFWFPTNILLLIPLILLIIIMIASTFIYRPFCRYICPFGAIASLVGRFSPFKIRRTDACLDCGICEKICPTLEAYRESNKGECYLCYRCIEFCKNEMFIDTQKLSQIKRLLTTISMNYCIIEKEQLFDTIIKDIIRLFAPCERKRFLDKLLKAFKGKSIISINCIQRIVISLRELFPDETKEINSQKYKKWIDLNEIQWKQNFEDIYLNKIIYGLNS